MALTVPSLDDRSYQQLVREALARIPVHNPEWTNFNDSDPGVTLVQLFAFMTESLLYRANQIPERNRRKFLTLLGIGVRPAESARGLITIQNERGPLDPQTFDAGLDVRAGAVPFRTTQGLQVLPVEARVFYKRKPQPGELSAEQQEHYKLLYADLIDAPGKQLSFYDSAPLNAPAPGAALPVVDLVTDTVDRCLWIALLARPNESPDATRAVIAGQTLTIGVMPGVTAEGMVLPEGRTSTAGTEARVAWEIAQPPPGGLLPPSGSAAKRQASYALLDARASGDILAAPGLVELTLPTQLRKPKENAGIWRNLEPAEEGTGDFPPSLADTDIQDRVITWLRLRVPSETSGTPPLARISWLGVNGTMVVQRAAVAGEVLGQGTGEPNQRLNLANTPAIPATLRLSVVPPNSDDKQDYVWERIDDLLAAAPEVPVGDPRAPLFVLDSRQGLPAPPVGALDKVYTLDPESGVVTFGDGAHGRRPRSDERVIASYAFGGGRAGNVGIGAIKSSPQLPAGFKIANPLPTWGGADAEEIASAERAIPRAVQHRDRLVSVQDFLDITHRTPGVELGRVEVLPLYDPVDKIESVPGVVTLMVVPRYDPLQPDAPMPDRLFLDAVCRYLQPRRLVTTEIYIRGPEYRDVWVSVGLQVLGGRATGPVREAVKRELRAFLSPLVGGRDGAGWPLGTPIMVRELEAIVARVDGVRLVKGVLLGERTGGGIAQIELHGLELPRLLGVEVALEEPLSLDDLRGVSAAPVAASVPIPVIPSRC